MGLCFWSKYTNYMRLRFGMMTPTLLELAEIADLHSHGDYYSAASLPSFMLEFDYSKSNKFSRNLVNTYLGYSGQSSGAPMSSNNGVSFIEHVVFLLMWICKFLACPRSRTITQELGGSSCKWSSGDHGSYLPGLSL